jgi:hypothetical protein
VIDLEVYDSKGNRVLLGGWGEKGLGVLVDPHQRHHAATAAIVSLDDARKMRDWLTAFLEERTTSATPRKDESR